jgi:hypothetical protein
MEAYKQNFQIDAAGAKNLKSQLRDYLSTYGFTEMSVDNKKLLFEKKFSWFQGWQFNPLNWKSQLEIHIRTNHTLSIDYKVEGNGFLTPLGFAELYNGFIKNLELCISGSEVYKSSNEELIKKAKSKVITAHVYMLLAIGISALLAILLHRFTDLKFLGYIGLLGGAFISDKFINKWLISKSDLTSVSETL